MSVYERRGKNTIWRMEIVSRKAARAPIAGKLTSFAKHKKALLDNLRAMYERGLKSEPFDPDKSWCSLTQVAELYFWWLVMKEETVPVADRVKRLRQIAEALGRARGLIDKAVGNDLFRGWCAEAGIAPAVYGLTEQGSILTRVADELENAVANLSTLERAAHRAAHDMRPSRGRPKGTIVLPLDCISGLARVYRTSTWLKPGAGNGPFARFVHAFLTAVD
jgi:hypothetical protein